LNTVTVTSGSTGPQCGDQKLTAGDKVVFTFDSNIDSTTATAAVVTAMAGKTLGTAVVAGDVGVATTMATVTLGGTTTMDVSAPVAFALGGTVKDTNGVLGLAADMSQTLARTDNLVLTLAKATNLHTLLDGKVESGDTLTATFSNALTGCTPVLDDWQTLASVQEGVDTLMGDNMAGTTNDVSRLVYTITMQPGKTFDLSKSQLLQVGGGTRLYGPVAWLPTSATTYSYKTAGITSNAIDDIPAKTATVTYIAKSAAGTGADFGGTTILDEGLWIIQSVSSGMSVEQFGTLNSKPAIFTKTQ
jgi:hypothetical protein